MARPDLRAGGRSGSLVRDLAWRYLRGGRSRLLTGSARAALLSTGLGVTAMVIAMALMSGYTSELREKILGSGAIIAYPQLSGAETSILEGEERLRSLPQVGSVSAVAFAQGSLSREARAAGLDVTVRGLDVGKPIVASGLMATTKVVPESTDAIPAALLGADLAARLEVEEEELLRLVMVEMADRGPVFRYRTVRFAGTFSTGFADYDRRWVVVDRRLIAGASAVLEIAPARGVTVEEARRAVEEELGDSFLVTDWEPHNRELFNALRLQKLALFLILGLIVVVSTFNVAATLVVMVRERLKEVGVLGALGLPARKLELVFVLCGGALGTLGTLLGLAVGSAASWILTTFRLIRFDSEVAAIYFISSVPFHVVPSDLLVIGFFSIGVTLLACWLPARRVARVDPAVALRFE